jgi:hypothetical protein
MSLSEERAQSVVAWLTAHGVEASRLTAKGYGDTKPIVPNVTDLNRQRNRRVQFVIKDQDPETSSPSTPSPSGATTKPTPTPPAKPATPTMPTF